jgi:DNA-binding response OmpR family regulator
METIKAKVLLCSPNPNFLLEHKSQLHKDFEVQVATTEEIALFLVKDWEAQLAIVDGDLLGNLTAQMRQNHGYSQLGIIVVAYTGGSFKEEYAFRTGADHFVFQVQDYKAIVWRLISLGRRLQSVHLPTHQNKPLNRDSDKTPSSITYKNVQIFPHDHLVKCNGRVVKVTPIQFKLLIAFIRHPETLLTREWLKEHIWEGARISLRSIDAQVSKLKKLLPEIDPDIINVYGKGYRMNSDSGPKAAA